ncbi:MAG TPA: hypothetical protein VK955_09455 [Xanthobacteraceae bacterium]|nr:hypothetical protein [Xanthobacteraceae bacterium]
MTAATASRPDLRPRNGKLLAAIAVLLLISFGVQVVRDRGWQPYQPESALWVRSGTAAAKLSIGYRNLVADIYWMRAVIYYGSKQRTGGERRNFDLLYPLLDLVTSLDPHFRVAYRFGAIFLTEAYPSGPGRPDLGLELLQRGIDRDFGNWNYYHDAGFIYYWWLKDPQKAAEWFSKAGDRPGAPEWLKPLAAVTLAEGGNRESSRRLFRELQNSDVPYVRKNAERRLLQLDAMDAIDDLNRKLEAFRATEHREPRDFREFALAQGLKSVPVDPAGVPYAVSERTGQFDLGPKSPLFPLPTGQNAAARQPQ